MDIKIMTKEEEQTIATSPYKPTDLCRSEHAHNIGHYSLLWDEVKFIYRDPHWYTRTLTTLKGIVELKFQ